MEEIDATLIGGGDSLSYQNGFVFNNNETKIVVAKVKHEMYADSVEHLLNLANNIYGQPRPVLNNTFEVLNQTISLIRTMLVFI